MPLILALALAAPDPFQSTAALDAAVAAFTGSPAGAPGGARAPVDARLKLAACAAPALEWHGPARDTVVIRCPAPAWRIFVPLNRAPAPVAAPAAAATPAARPAPVIRRGDPLVVEAGGAGFAIAREGVAMGDAAPGARLLVKIDPKRPPIQAVAVEPGRARLPGFGS